MNKENTFKVSIKDYQIIKKAYLEFYPGLNVITGPSNNGKTSIFKAIKANVFTVPGSTSIRVGANNFIVGIEYNGHIVILQKAPKESAYLIDGERYTKFGVTTPQIIADDLNIRELELNGNKEQLNFWDQMNYPFLLDRTSVELFRFIVDSGDDDQVSKALKDMVVDRKTISRDIDIIQGSINTVDLEIDSYKKQLEESKPIIEACNSIIALQSKVSRLNSMKELNKDIENTNTSIREVDLDLSNIDKDLSNINPVLNSIKLKVDKLNIIKDIYLMLTKINKDKENIDIDLNKINKIANYKSISTDRRNQLLEIYNNINSIKDQENTTNKDIELQNKYTNINIEDKVDKLDKYKSISNTIDLIRNDLHKLDEDIKYNNDELNLYNSYSDLFDICPLCGSKLHKEHNKLKEV